MRASLLPLTTMMLLAGTAGAQVNAGDVPPGTTAVSYGIDLVLNDPFTMTSATFELDCDDQSEISAVLIRGEPAIDAPNIARLELLVPDMELCMDLATYERPQYYAFGQPLDCSGSFDWQDDSVNVLGDIGTFTAIGPFVIDSMYVAFRMGGSQIGWILLSFDLTGGLLPVRLQIHEVLQLCGSTAVIDLGQASPSLVLSSNPNSGQLLQVESTHALESIELLDPTGKILARYDGTVRMIPAPEVPGSYLVRAFLADGRRSITRLVRQ